MIRLALTVGLAACVNVPPFAGGDGGPHDGNRDGGNVDARTDRITVHVADRANGAPVADAAVYFGTQATPTGIDGIATGMSDSPLDVTVVVESPNMQEITRFVGASNGDELFVGEPDTRATPHASLQLELLPVGGYHYQAFGVCGSTMASTPTLQLPRTSRCGGPLNNILLVRRQDGATGAMIDYKNIQVAGSETTFMEFAANYTLPIQLGVQLPTTTANAPADVAVRALTDGEVVSTWVFPVPQDADAVMTEVSRAGDAELEIAVTSRPQSEGTLTILRRQPASSTDATFDYSNAPPRAASITLTSSGATATKIGWTNRGGQQLPTLTVISAHELRGDTELRWRWIVPFSSAIATEYTFPPQPTGVPAPGPNISVDVQHVRIPVTNVMRAAAIADRCTVQPSRYFALPFTGDIAVTVGTRQGI